MRWHALWTTVNGAVTISLSITRCLPHRLDSRHDVMNESAGEWWSAEELRVHIEFPRVEEAFGLNKTSSDEGMMMVLSNASKMGLTKKHDG